MQVTALGKLMQYFSYVEYQEWKIRCKRFFVKFGDNFNLDLRVLSHLIQNMFFSIKPRTIQNHKPLIFNKAFFD